MTPEKFQNATAPVTRLTSAPEPVTLESIMSKLIAIESRLADIEESLEAIDVRVSDISLDTGRGYEVD
jgi:hypothetical protein